MTRPDFDVVNLTKNLISNNISQEVNVIKRDDEKRINFANEDYIIVSETDQRETNNADPRYNTYNGFAAARIQIISKKRENREKIWDEIIRISQEYSTRRKGTPGDWDNIQTSTTTFEDERNKKYIAVVEFQYRIKSISQA